MPDLRPWKRIKERYESGKSVPYGVRKMAEAALGESFMVRQKPGARPDSRDRQAGDDSFNDDRDGGVVVL